MSKKYSNEQKEKEIKGKASEITYPEKQER